MKWKFENIDIIFSCHENDFERTSNYSRNKLKTDDRIIDILNYNTDNIDNDLIKKNEIFMIDKDNNSNRLLFDLSIDKHPFLKFIPNNSIYLCYHDGKNYIIYIIVNPMFKKDDSYENYKIMFEKKWIDKFNLKEKEKLKYIELKLKIAPSLIFPVSNFNVDDYIYMNKFYDSEIIKLNDNDIFFEKYYNLSMRNCLSKIGSINKIIQYLIRYCNCNINFNSNNISENIFTKISNEESLNSFILDHRICKKSSCNTTVNFSRINDDLMSNINFILTSITNVNDIINNFDKWILIMEYNILLQTIQLFNANNSCWDIQNILNILNSILYFNEKIQENNYYYG